MSEATYRKASKAAGGCPIEAGLLLKLADNECPHGRLPGDRSEPCGCWGASVVTLLDVFRDRTRLTPDELVERRARVAELYGAGVPIKGIARQLRMSYHTVQWDLRAMRRRGLVGSRAKQAA